MAEGRIERRLTAILAADVAGYSRLVGEDEEGTLAALKTLRRELIDPGIAEYKGRIVKTTGDGLLVEFASVVDALRCAAGWQRAIAERNVVIGAEKRLLFRIGIHQGDIVVEDGDIFGDGVNVAARLEGLAEPGGICVSARVQEDAAGRLDLTFEDIGEQELKNIARKVRVYRVRPASPHPNPPPPAGEGAMRAAAPDSPPPQAGEGRVGAAEPPLALPDKPSIAVLPFQNMSGDPEQEYFVDGMVEEIITALSRIRWLFVIARNSSFTYKGQAVDVTQVGRELGVRYVLEGSVRKSGNRVRITGQLIDAETGAHLWADRFDGSLDDVFDLQDQVASSVAGVIEPALQAAEIRRSAARPTTDLTAYDLYLRAYSMFWSSAQVPKALALLEQAIERDPHYGLALAWAGICCYRMLQDGRSGDREADGIKGHDYARRALEVAGDDPAVLANAADALAFFGEDIGAVMALADRALALNRNYARGWHVSAVVRVQAGLPDIAIEHAEVALRLSPRARVGSTIFLIGVAHFFSRRFNEAVPKLLLGIQENPTFTSPYRYLAASYAHMGRIDEARQIITRLRAITSVVIPDSSRFQQPEHRELLLSGLRLAAGETG
jgi:TolB-like protein/class 3 adenylate cyclase